MPEAKNWIVTTSGDRSLSEIVKDLVKSGFKVNEVYNEIGCIMGSANEDVVKQLKNISGISDVSPEPPPIDIGPPDASIS
jgi:hypothetical protein